MTLDFESPNFDDMTVIFTYETDEGEPAIERFPAKAEVCERCNGRGVHDSPAFVDGIPMDEFYDEDFRADYLDGLFTVSCSECQGRRVTLVIDQPRANLDVLAIYNEWVRDHYESEATCRAERMMGA